MKPTFAINVDLDRVKFSSKQDPNLTHDLANKLKLRNVTVGQENYYSWILYFSDLSHDAYRGTLKVLLSQYTADPKQVVISGNGIESHFQELCDLFG